MAHLTIPPAEEQLDVLVRGAVDLHPKEDLEARLKKSHETQTPLVIKTGFDPTAPDLHIGHTVVFEKMAQFQRFGHDVVFLVGDYTALVGDPTGRNAMRPPLTEGQIADNAKTYTDQVFKVLDPERTRVEFNASWLGKLSFNDTIMLASKYNVGRMLERRDFKQRFEQNKQIAVHEFLYPLMQGYDSVALKADVELGGHDQIFNLNVGRHIMEQYGLKSQCVLTVGLLVGLDGADKMSKSKGNHIGITEKPEDMFGKVMSISDALMWDWYTLLMDHSPDPATSDPLDAKKHLAQTLVARFHDDKAGQEVRAWWDAGRPVQNAETVDVVSAPLHNVLVQCKAATGRRDATRKIQQGGVSLSGERVQDANQVVASGEYLLKVGKKWAKNIRVSQVD